MTDYRTTAACDGRLIPPWLVEYHERMQRAHQPHRFLLDLGTRIRLHRAETAQRSEDVTVRALVVVANRCGDVEFAAHVGGEHRGDEDAAARIAREHGFDAGRLVAFRGLARSRGVPLADVLRAALRGELRRVVERPPVYERRGDEAQD